MRRVCAAHGALFYKDAESAGRPLAVRRFFDSVSVCGADQASALCMAFCSQSLPSTKRETMKDTT